MKNAVKPSFLVIVAIFLMGASECSNSGAPALAWNPRFWVADSRTQSIVSKDEWGRDEQMLCADKRFDSMVAMDKTEVRKAKEAYNAVINQCERWKTPEVESAARHAFDWTRDLHLEEDFQ